jgi:hypothetical protein
MLLDNAFDRGNGTLQQIEPAMDVADGIDSRVWTLRILHYEYLAR